ncbi:MAG: PAS domain S-box protein [Acidobacteriia bacterium]|nr:PAS domain S-box protein [Terriglobia bacterium]
MAEAGADRGRFGGNPNSASPALWSLAVTAAAGVWIARLVVQFALKNSPLSDSVNKGFDAAVPLLVGLVMLWTAWRIRSAGAGPTDAWWLLTVAYLSYGAAEIPFAAFGVGLSQGLVAYVSNGAYIIFYVLFLCAALRLPAAPLAAQERLKLLLDTGIVLMAAGLVEWTLLVAPAVHQPGFDPFRVFVTVAFLVGDLMVLWALIELLLRRRDPAMETIYSLLAAAAAFLILTDVAWGRRVLLLDKSYDWALGPGWTTSHLLACLAALWALVKPYRPGAVAAAPTGMPAPRTSLYLADGCVGVAVAVLVFRHLRDVTVVSAVLVVGVGILLATRHILRLRENTRLYGQLRTAHDELESKVQERTAELYTANVGLQSEVAERARAEGEVQRRLKELILLSAVTEIAVEATDEDELITRATLAIRGTLFPDNCGFMFVREAEGTLRRTPSFHGVASPEALEDVPLGRGVTGMVAVSGVARRVADTGREAEYIAGEPGMRSELCVPLRVGNRIVGVIDVESWRPDAFTEDDERVLGTVASQVAAAIERLRAGEALRQSEQNYREVFNATSEAIFVHDAGTGAILDVNQTMLDMYGYARAEALGLTVGDLSVARAPVTQEDAEERIRRAIEEGPQVFEWLAKRKDGLEFWVEVTLRSSPIGGKGRVLAVVRDIGDRKRAEEALRLSEERFRSMVQQAYDFITVLDASGNIVYESPSTDRILGYGPGGLTGTNGFTVIHPGDLPLVQQRLARLAAEGSSGRATQYRVRRADGSWIWVESLGNNLLDNPAVRGIVLTSREITERKRAEAELHRKVEELTVLNAVAEIAVEAEDEDILISRATEIIREALYPEDCGVLLVDDEAGVLRYTPSYRQGVTGLNREPIQLGTGITGNVASTGNPRREGDVTRVNEYVARVPGMRSEVCVPMRVGQRVVGVVNAESSKADAFTEHDEAVLGTIAGQLATALGRLSAAAAQKESEERFRRLADAAFEGIGITDQGRIVDTNARLAEMFGYSPAELLGRKVMDLVAPEAAEAAAGVMREGRNELYEHLAIRKDGTVFPVETQGRPLRGGGTMRVAAVRDITERKRAEQRIQRQLERLAALRAIDTAITGGMELADTLDLFLAHLLAQLHVDASDILLVEQPSKTLAFAAGKGFHSDAIRQTRLAPGECYAGRAAADRRTIAVPDLVATPNGFSRSSLLAGEGFRIYFAAPLVAKGHVHGVLEVYNRKPFEPDREWLDYLDTLAGQLAIAIDNRTLFESLQRSNADLALAYDRTLEGWSKALELRDRETHGHTARVLELTVRLAREMGVPTEDLVHVRRGALLHDIGKMAIPDSILLKPGPLTEEEWGVMRQHPQFAFELLSPIGFLQQAVVIPYSHHEHWDGTGYPRGLAGEAIPLAARIFAVIDSWDALRFARPYREAWVEERVRAFLREEAGKRFDPFVVEAFLGMSA